MIVVMMRENISPEEEEELGFYTLVGRKLYPFKLLTPLVFPI